MVFPASVFLNEGRSAVRLGLCTSVFGFVLHAVSAHCWGGTHQFRPSMHLLPAVVGANGTGSCACGFVMVLLGLMVLVAGVVQLDGNSTVHVDSFPDGSTAPTAPAAGRESPWTRLLHYVRMNGLRLQSAMGYFDHPQRRLLARPLGGGLSRRKDGMTSRVIPICDPRRMCVVGIMEAKFGLGPYVKTAFSCKSVSYLHLSSSVSCTSMHVACLHPVTDYPRTDDVQWLVVYICGGSCSGGNWRRPGGAYCCVESRLASVCWHWCYSSPTGSYQAPAHLANWPRPRLWARGRNLRLLSQWIWTPEWGDGDCWWWGLFCLLARWWTAKVFASDGRGMPCFSYGGLRLSLHFVLHQLPEETTGISLSGWKVCSCELWQLFSSQGDAFGCGCEKDCACELLGVRVHHSFAGYYFFARCCLGKVPGGAPFSQLHKGIGSVTRTGHAITRGVLEPVRNFRDVLRSWLWRRNLVQWSVASIDSCFWVQRLGVVFSCDIVVGQTIRKLLLTPWSVWAFAWHACPHLGFLNFAFAYS